MMLPSTLLDFLFFGVATNAERGTGGGRAGEREEHGGVPGGAGLRGEEARGLHGALQRRPVGALSF